MATIEGTAFDPFYGEYTQFSYKDDVRIGDEWRVLLREVHQNTKEETALDSISEYRFSVPAGIYEIALPNPRQFIAYRRAHVRLLPGTHNKINVYPIHHTGVAETINGDVALPDPKLSYDDYHPDTENPEIDLLVQYGARTKGATHVKYRGPFLMLTFDTLTLSARTCVLDPRTLRTVAKNVLVDLGRTRMRADRAELNPHDRVIKVFLADGRKSIISDSFNLDYAMNRCHCLRGELQFPARPMIRSRKSGISNTARLSIAAAEER